MHLPALILAVLRMTFTKEKATPDFTVRDTL